ncbi:hypothetical protein VYU27_008166 [Nannochloropsis oceanica]
MILRPESHKNQLAAIQKVISCRKQASLKDGRQLNKKCTFDALLLQSRRGKWAVHMTISIPTGGIGFLSSHLSLLIGSASTSPSSRALLGAGAKFLRL